MRQSKPGSVYKATHTLWYPIILCLFIIQLAACSPPLTVGILAGLTGSQSELGVAGRNGAMFRFEEENAHRGMNRFVPMVENDQNEPQRVPKLVQSLRRAGVAVVVGPFTSTIALAVTKEKEELLFFFSNRQCQAPGWPG